MKSSPVDASKEYYTPVPIIEAARNTMGAIDLDPASCEEANETVKASHFYTRWENGLSLPWNGRVWLNPPFGKLSTKDFADKLQKEFRLGNVEQACLLIPFTNDNRGLARLLGKFIHCHPAKKVFFKRPGGSTSDIWTPILIFYLGNNQQLFSECFSHIGPTCLPFSKWSGLIIP